MVTEKKNLHLNFDLEENAFQKKSEQVFVVETPNVKPKITDSMENSPRKEVKEHKFFYKT